MSIAKFWAWGWAGASGRHAVMQMRGETTGRKLNRIERRKRVAVKRWECDIIESREPNESAETVERTKDTL